MKTDDLIKALAADLPNKPAPLLQSVVYALACSIPIIAVLLMLVAPPRPDLAGMMLEPKVVFKFVFTIGLFASALWLALRLSRPGAGAGPARWAIVAMFGLLAVAVVIELLSRAPSTVSSAMIGSYGIPCLALIGLFSIAPLTALMVAFRAGAPDSPTLAGAAAGLVAGALAATFYATHCVEDSALFLSLWYVLGISAVTVAGAVVGRTALKW